MRVLVARKLGKPSRKRTERPHEEGEEEEEDINYYIV
jgi:hypothetical protein